MRAAPSLRPLPDQHLDHRIAVCQEVEGPDGALRAAEGTPLAVQLFDREDPVSLRRGHGAHPRPVTSPDPSLHSL